jgi:hypothetical protein
MELWPHLWSSGQSSWLQIQRPGFDSRRYQIFWEVVALGWGPLSPLSTTEELLEIKSSRSGLESREYGYRDPPRWSRGTLYLQKLALTSPTSGGRSVGIVHSRTNAMEFFFVMKLKLSESTWLTQGYIEFLIKLRMSNSQNSCVLLLHQICELPSRARICFQNETISLPVSP